jgi:hypothetical protein
MWIFHTQKAQQYKEIRVGEYQMTLTAGHEPSDRQLQTILRYPVPAISEQKT